jgi:hypothetical protein
MGESPTKGDENRNVAVGRIGEVGVTVDQL